MAVVPVLAMMLATLHFFFRQQEAEAVRRAAAEAAERETALAARHVQELEASERRFHSAFTHASIGMALLAFDGRILQANPALRVLLGAAATSCRQRTSRTWCTKATARRSKSSSACADGRDFEGFARELRCRHRRRAVWVAAHCSFFSEPGASAPCLILQVQDITARRKAEGPAAHRLPRQPDRPAQPAPLPRTAGSRPSQRAQADPQTLRGDVPGLRPLQAHQRQPGPQRRRRVPGAGVARRIRSSLRPATWWRAWAATSSPCWCTTWSTNAPRWPWPSGCMDVLRQPFQVAGTELTTSASIGITFSASATARRGRAARRRHRDVQGQGRRQGALRAVRRQPAHRGGRPVRLEGDLRRAIDDGSSAWPTSRSVRPGTGRIAGFEALVRWQHPEDGPSARPPSCRSPRKPR
jgi:PAS domain S-box-containing protein